MSEETKYTKEYYEGCEAARVDFHNSTKCPYKRNTVEYKRWRDGYGYSYCDTVFWAGVAAEQEKREYE